MKTFTSVVLLICGFLGMVLNVESYNSSHDENEDDLEQLCEHSDDVTCCVRDFFETNAKCSVIRIPNNKPVYKETQIAYVPVVNCTFVLDQTTISGLDGTIEKFYTNKKSKNLVMSVSFKGIILETNQGKFVIHRKGKEPKIVADHSYAIYPVILTAVIPARTKITARTLKKSTVWAYSPQKQVEYQIGEVIRENKDPDVVAVVAGINANVPIVVQELFLTLAPDFFLAYLQKYICDYGLEGLFH